LTAKTCYFLHYFGDYTSSRLNCSRALRSRTISRRRSQISRPFSTPRLPGPVRSPWKEAPRAPCTDHSAGERKVSFQLLSWKLEEIELEPPRFTRPPRYLLEVWDVRIRRYTSPTGPWRVPVAVSPLLPSPCSRTDQGTQTVPLSRVHRGTQVGTLHTVEQSTQSDSDWETPNHSAATQTDQPDANNNCLGSLKVSVATYNP